jgi:hypothetical protein
LSVTVSNPPFGDVVTEKITVTATSGGITHSQQVDLVLAFP